MRPDGNQVIVMGGASVPGKSAHLDQIIGRGKLLHVKRILTRDFPAAMPVQPAQRAVRRAELLSLLRLPADARLQFGGREWLQDFDDEACLIVTVPR